MWLPWPVCEVLSANRRPVFIVSVVILHLQSAPWVEESRGRLESPEEALRGDKVETVSRVKRCKPTT
ncbi:Hypothetical protein SMAX5B_020662 [Scophthalmus maximus]|uniref:Uncharacterized protein n=1 Tax=Scophthalmus maximus TaxID=52904 RepID=A0A2U9AZV0_SCOMX|nr:Hypothetical protein SMAX5B_020662 [Scophthalmus maximus]KAF0044946.1 hypothetical protein F2P81_001475 [Scophthalmus maximus]KAF0044947.1 hypothetical protein F2P81_001476 [Scophthalmus maximus]